MLDHGAHVGISPTKFFTKPTLRAVSGIFNDVDIGYIRARMDSKSQRCSSLLRPLSCLETSSLSYGRWCYRRNDRTGCEPTQSSDGQVGMGMS